MESGYVKLKDIKPALSGYIRKSQTLLKKYPLPDEKVIHDVRVLMKKSRAILKMIDSQLENDFSAKDMLAFREVGRLLGTWRDSSIHTKTLKDLKKEYPNLFSRLESNEELKSLINEENSTTNPEEEIKERLEKIDDLLNKSAYRIRFQSMDKLDPLLLLKRLEITYSNTVNVYLKCRNRPKPENFHEFRKRGKDFLYQLYFFRPLNPPAVKTLEKKLEALTQNLGRYNDITQLIKALDYKFYERSNLPDLDELIIRMREQQDQYLAKIWPAAFKIFCPGKELVNALGFRVLIL